MADETPKKDRTTAIIWVIGIIFLGGMAYRNIETIDGKTNANAEKIVTVEKKADANREAIHKEELARTKMIGKVDAIADDMGEVKEDFKDLKEYLMDYDFGPKKGN
jgi:hypothetical protein